MRRFSQDNIQLWDKISYSFGILGKNIAHGLLCIIILVYSLQLLRLPFSFVISIFLLSLLIESIFALLAGLVFDHSRSRMGKYKICPALGSFITLILSLLFISIPESTPETQPSRCHVAVLIISINCAIFLVQLPYLALISSFSSNATTRNLIATVPNAANFVGRQFIFFAMLGLINHSQMLQWQHETFYSVFTIAACLLVFSQIVFILCINNYQRRMLSSHEVHRYHRIKPVLEEETSDKSHVDASFFNLPSASQRYERIRQVESFVPNAYRTTSTPKNFNMAAYKTSTSPAKARSSSDSAKGFKSRAQKFIAPNQAQDEQNIAMAQSPAIVSNASATTVIGESLSSTPLAQTNQVSRSLETVSGTNSIQSPLSNCYQADTTPSGEVQVTSVATEPTIDLTQGTPESLSDQTVNTQSESTATLESKDTTLTPNLASPISNEETTDSSVPDPTKNVATQLNATEPSTKAQAVAMESSSPSCQERPEQPTQDQNANQNHAKQIGTKHEPTAPASQANVLTRPQISRALNGKVAVNHTTPLPRTNVVDSSSRAHAYSNAPLRTKSAHSSYQPVSSAQRYKSMNRHNTVRVFRSSDDERAPSYRRPLNSLSVRGQVNFESLQFSHIFTAFLKNDQLMLMFVIGIIQYVIFSLMSTLVFQFFMDQNLTHNIVNIICLLLGIICQFASIMLYPRLALDSRRAKVWINGNILTCTAFVIHAFLQNINSDFIFLLLPILFLIFNVGMGVAKVAITSMVADTVDYGEFKLSVRNDALVFAYQSVSLRLGLFISGTFFFNTDMSSTVYSSVKSMLPVPVDIIFEILLICGLLAVILYTYQQQYKLNGAFYRNVLNNLQFLRQSQRHSPNYETSSYIHKNFMLRYSLDIKTVIVKLKASNENEMIQAMVQKLNEVNAITSEHDYMCDLRARLALGPCGIAEGIAIPHAKSSAVKRATVVVATLDQPLDLGALDGKECDLVFLLASPDDGVTHMNLLGRLSLLLNEPNFADKLRTSSSSTELFERLIKCEKNISQ